MKRLMPLFGAIALVIALAAPVANHAIAAANHNLEDMVATAKTEAEHNAVAAEYESSAKALEAQAVAHDKMAKTYKGHPSKGADLSSHCESLAANYRDSAKLNRQLAEAHRELARTAR